METLTDEQLVDGFRDGGNMSCFDEMVRRHTPRMRAIVAPMVLNETDADDLVQQAFINAFRGIRHFRGGSRVSTWLHRIAVNAAYSFLRSRQRRIVEPREEPPDEPAMAHEAPDRQYLMGELSAAVQSALERLSPKLRAAVTMILLNDMDVGEAARVEKCSIATMYWRVHQARKELDGPLRRYYRP